VLLWHVRRSALLGLLLCVRCAAPPEPPDFALRIGVPLPLAEPSPTKHSGSAAMVGDLVYEPLLRPVPGGLTSKFLRRWSPLGRDGWLLEVGGGARFSDGADVGPEDVARSLRAFEFEVAREGEVLTVTAPRGADRLAALLHVQVFQEGEFRRGTGPFELAQQGQDRLRLRRLQPRPRRPHAVEFVGAPSTRELFSMLLKGDVDAIAPLDQAQEELLQGMTRYRVLRSAAPNALVVLFNPARVSQAQRLALREALPMAEIGRAAAGPACRPTAERSASAMPSGDLLHVGYYDYTDELRRAALALRRALGTRGGDVAVTPEGEESAGLAMLVTMRLVWPAAMLRRSAERGGPLNVFGYASRRYQEALGAGDDAAADAALRDDPPLAIICRRERRAAVDARYRNATLGEWGALETLVDWERTP